MEKQDRFQQLVADFSDSMDFLTVYVEEAHPEEGWALKDTGYSINKHRNLEDRIRAASILKNAGSKCPIMVDTMENKAAVDYAAVPEALYVIQDGVVKFKANGPNSYNPDVLKKWLEKHVSQRN